MDKLQLSNALSTSVAVLLLLLVLSTPNAWGWRSFKVIFTSIPFTYNADVVDVKAHIQNNTDDTTINVAITFNEDTDDIYMKYIVALEVTEGNYTALINRSVNVCKFLKQHSMEPQLRLVYEDLLKQNNFIKSCPIKRGTYTIREYRIDEEMLPSYVPETNFYFDLKLSKASGESFFDGRLHGKIDKSKGFNNLKMFSLG